MKKTITFACYLIVGIIAFLFISALTLPSLLSTHWAQQILKEKLSQRLSGTVDFHDLQLSWLGKQQIQGLSVENNQGFKVFSSDLVFTDTSLFTILFTQSVNKSIELKNGHALLVIDPQESSSVPHLLGFNHKSISCPIELEISDLFLHLTNLHTHNEPFIQAHGNTLYEGEKGSFHMKGTLSSMQIEASHFPTLLVNHYLKLSHPALGDLAFTVLQGPLNLQMETFLKDKIHLFSLKGETSTSQITVNGAISSDQIEATSPAEISFTFTPELLGYFKKTIPSMPEIFFPSNSKGILMIDQLIVPLHSNPSQMTLKAEMHLPSFSIPENDSISSFTANLLANPLIPLIELKFFTQGLHQKLPFTLNGELFAAKPQQWASFKEEMIKNLEFGLTAEAEQLTGNIKGDLKADVLNARVDLKIPQGELKDFHISTNAILKRSPLHYSGIIKSLDFNNEWYVKGAIEADIEKKILTVQGNAEENGQKLEYRLQYPDPLTSTQKWNVSTFPLFLKGSFSHLPLGKIVNLIFSNDSASKNLEAAFGNFLKGQFDVNWIQGKGPLRLTLEGDNGRLFLHGNLIENRLALLEPLQFETNLNSQESKQIMAQYLPFLHHLVSIDAPLKLTIHPEDSSFPLDSLEKRNFSFKQAVATIGKMHFDGKGKISQLFTVLNLSYSGPVSLQSTPFYIKADQGVFTLYRSDLLLNDTYHLALWGNANFIKDKWDMILGIDGKAIQKTWNVTEVPVNKFLLVPIKGTINSPQLDSTKVIAQLSAWKLQNQGKSVNSFLGVALEAVTGGYKDTQIPEPTTYPFPWENENSFQEEALADQPVKKKSSPHKQVRKKAKSLIKGLVEKVK